MEIDLDKLATEERNPATMDIDRVSTLEMVKMINNEDKKVVAAVEKELESIAAAVDVIAVRLEDGGRLIYIGAGTSGRLGVLDASECPPTFGVDPTMVQGIIAGGDMAIRTSVEGAEDDMEEAIHQLKEIGLNHMDVLVGIAASGRTPYVVGALQYGRKVGAATISVSCSPDSEIAKAAEVSITPVVGPEAITGSTRMKAGTAQKMVLNMLSTGAMVRLGKVYENYMIDVQALNEKLVERCKKIVMEVTGVSKDVASATLEDTDYDVKLAIFLIKTGLDIEIGQKILNEHKGRLGSALEGSTELVL
ncbi:N-acetylmuramic acid 6-phosphate etherase [Anaerosolibacter sp.]|uniref:N-acetylmuramic acid 6-phosphate etherase n=1 Tax=Anaerosolibacter sp. TaxID=1872527 RepID=UPI0039EFDAE4